MLCDSGRGRWNRRFTFRLMGFGSLKLPVCRLRQPYLVTGLGQRGPEFLAANFSLVDLITPPSKELVQAAKTIFVWLLWGEELWQLQGHSMQACIVPVIFSWQIQAGMFAAAHLHLGVLLFQLRRRMGATKPSFFSFHNPSFPTEIQLQQLTETALMNAISPQICWNNNYMVCGIMNIFFLISKCGGCGVDW